MTTIHPLLGLPIRGTESYKRAFCLILLFGLLAFTPRRVDAAITIGPDPGTATATGNLSGGVHSGTDFFSPPINTLNVNSVLGAILPGAGTAGIFFQNTSGGNVVLNSGVFGNNVLIGTSGAVGIYAQSIGAPPANPPLDPFLGIPIPSAPNVGGGVVTVNSYSDIFTSGANAHGINARSATTGYPDSVIQQLNAFTGAGITFSVSSVGGIGTNVNRSVQGTLVDTNGNAIAGAGGTFIIHADGSYSFNPGNDFTNMVVGQTRQTTISYGVHGVSGSVQNQSGGTLVVEVTRTASGFVINPGAYLSQFGPSANPSSVLPDLRTYVAGLVRLASAGGAGNSVFVTNRGSIHTSGPTSHGILAQSIGGDGPGGSGGSISSSADAGGTGRNGGNAVVEANGSITTSDVQSSGVTAISQGGNGGNGGDGGTWRYGARGGTGANGGEVLITGDAVIHTTGAFSSGIIALSSGGNGGNGGSGKVATGGGNGGFGGQGGAVVLDGTWDITTEGDKAHGIWAKSVGGNAGSGGSGGWLTGSPGGGGQATDGGSVSVTSGGFIRTYGSDSYGIYAESVGGFGGSGGSSSGIFYSSGGDGNSAGSGGTVSVMTTSNSSIVTTGARGHGIYAQSVGGGGGSGGGSSGLVGVGGSGAAGGRGSSVSVVNDGTIWASGVDSRGIYAQSVGGGGGDGGNSSGLVAIGGSGSGTSDGGTVSVVNNGTITSAAHSIFAESIGGGGGSGGFSSGWFSVGGSGGGGGNASSVSVANTGNLMTSQANSSAIFAQSVGGGGGNGGGSVAAGAFGAVAVGGAAATGGNGGLVSVSSGTNTILTLGNQSHGLFVQSVGGGGGNGGYAVSVAAGEAASAAIAVGGKGGGGGSSSDVNVFSQSQITTVGDMAHGIFAQSVGGGGGSGGFAIAASASLSGFSGSFSLGGQGGSGGHAGTVDLTSLGDIMTSGSHSYGLLAQSVGGGGGDGGFAVAGTFTATGVGAAIGIGGKGGRGGYSSDVTLTNGGNVTTLSNDSHAVFAQSVGGGGGSGGFSVAGTLNLAGSSLSLSIGGEGGTGGSAGNVIAVSMATNTAITTYGQRAYGVIAQSLGGGGGDGGFAVAGTISSSSSATLGFGGSGGTAGNGGTVFLDNVSSIATYGSNSHGLFAQSVGGGGGSGGFSVAGSLLSSGSANLGFGGSGSGGGNANDVTLLSRGDTIVTTGQRSYGALAQSLGGGGGDGGFAIGAGISGGSSVNLGMGGNAGTASSAGNVLLASRSTVVTRGDDSHALFAQSAGGGGGSGGFSVAGGISGSGTLGIGLGGSGGGGGNSGNVTLLSAGTNLMTSGERSYGILAQSVGGGGGDGGFSIAGGISRSASVNFSMGGSGAGAGNAGVVLVSNASQIYTYGSNSHAIFAQSVGGGGGSGGFSVAGGISTGNAVDASVGGAGGNGGNGNNVLVTNNASVLSTSGDRSYGMLAQSIGGGGGDGGFSVAGGISKSASVSFSMGGVGGAGSSAGEVDLFNSSIITTLGTNSHGIFAQSVGGSGGSGGFSVAGSITTETNSLAVSASLGGAGGAGSAAGRVNVTSTGAWITTGGDRSYGILAQSVGGGGGDGGFSIAGGISASKSVNFSLGGAGGAGSIGGDVNLLSSSSIYTTGDGSHGIFAQSVGGSGGSGGFSVAGGIAASNSIQVSIGGSGGTGSMAGNVSLVSTGALISTYGTRASGILAQSIGGGGGDGGFSVAGGLSKGGSADFSIGGNGAGGGIGQRVSVLTTSDIFTRGELAYGILAQSIGGGGGNGGFSIAGTISKDRGGLSFSMGGAGGAGGHAGSVELTSTGIIETTNNGAHGILAQSIGGSGGAGGFSGSLAGGFGDGSKLAMSIGGWGGDASYGDAVNVTNTGLIVTEGAAAYGIFAQSIGGGGGDGGDSAAFSFGLKQTNSVNVSLDVGGFGGGGGDGGSVMLSNTADIFTTGEKAHAIVAQSIGGGGGNGGFSISGSVGKGTNTHEFDVSVGGFSGSGGNAGAVHVFNSGNIVTLGQGSGVIDLPDDAITVHDPRGGTNLDGAIGILAQSIGGGGGNGGFSFAGAFGLKGSESKNLSVSVGGFGGPAGRGEDVTVINSGSIDTFAVLSHGILAQSIGGGGGNGGWSAGAGLGFGGGQDTWNVNVAVAIGGHGGNGDVGGDVLVANSGAITTRNNDSHGIFAQSIGGGGGNGGDSFTATIGLGAAGGGRTFNANVAVGGVGGVGNVAGDVSVDNAGILNTFGDKSDGIHAQSIGGGGGDGGSSRGLSLLLKAGSANLEKGQSVGANWKLQFNIGGNGGSANDGNAVTINNQGAITTSGTMSRGIVAQSVGGGGGSGGDGMNAIGFEGEDYVKLGLLLTDAEAKGGSGNFVIKKLLQQLRDISVAVGGNAGASGNGNHVAITNSGDITTFGYASTAIFAQSIGGGGGEAQAFGEGQDKGGKAVGGLTGKFSMGGAGGSAGNGGAVDIVNTSALNTFGDGAYGIFAQSVGGGGGVAGNVDLGLKQYLNIGLGLAYGQAGGGGGNGGAVTVLNTGDITTRGESAYGIFAQSVGGGGGVGSSVGYGLINQIIRDNFAGSVGGNGSAGDIKVTQNGNITTLGSDSDGIFAQSAGGRDSGGKVEVDVTGNITIQGTNANGIFAQSRGGLAAGGQVPGTSAGGTGSDISVSLLQGTIQGGSGEGAGVRIADGANNTVTNFGTITALSQTALIGGIGAETVHNSGRVIGSVDLGDGRNTFYNYSRGLFDSGARVYLGAGNYLYNTGTLSPGGTKSVQATALTGNLVQDGNGILQSQWASTSAYDRISASGTAALDGKLSVSMFNAFLPKKADQFHVVSASQGVTGTFSSLDDPIKGQYALQLHVSYFPTFATVQVIQDSFDTFALTANERSVARDLDKVSGLGTMGGDSREANLITLLDTIAGTNLYHAFDLIAPEEFGVMFDLAAGAANVYSRNIENRLEAVRFGNAGSGSLSLSDPYGRLTSSYGKQGGGGGNADSGEHHEDDWNIFALGSGELVDVQDTKNARGYDIETAGATVGADRRVGEKLAFGISASYVGTRSFLVNNGKVTVNGARVGLYGTWFDNGFYVNGAMEGGYNFYDTRRTSIDGMAAGSTQGPEFDSLLGGGYDFKCGRAAFGPVASVQYIGIGVDSFTEKGSLAPLTIEHNNDNSLRSLIGGRVSYDLPMGSMLLRPQVQLGWQHEFLDTDHPIDSRFASGAGSVFTVHSPDLGRDSLSVSGGLTMQWSRSLSTYLYYSGEMARVNYSAHSINLGISITF